MEQEVDLVSRNSSIVNTQSIVLLDFVGNNSCQAIVDHDFNNIMNIMIKKNEKSQILSQMNSSFMFKYMR